jgi:carboxylesterase type B
VGNTNNEGASSGGKLDSAANKISGCAAGRAAKFRRDAGVPAWNYLYAGEFPNMGLGPCCPNAEGAWHGAEIALIFGTTEYKQSGEIKKDTENEKTLAKAMRVAWSSFAKDPVHGLEKLGWPMYDGSSKFAVCALGFTELTLG